MISTPNKHSSSVRSRRIGRKVLQADRLARALSDSPRKTKRVSFSFPTIPPKSLALACLGLIVVGAIGYVGVQAQLSKAAAAERAAYAKQQEQLRAKSAAADACRQEKAAQKADQLGKITYDELYDYGSCDK